MNLSGWDMRLDKNSDLCGPAEHLKSEEQYPREEVPIEWESSYKWSPV